MSDNELLTLGDRDVAEKLEHAICMTAQAAIVEEKGKEILIKISPEGEFNVTMRGQNGEHLMAKPEEDE